MTTITHFIEQYKTGTSPGILIARHWDHIPLPANADEEVLDMIDRTERAFIRDIQNDLELSKTDKDIRPSVIYRENSTMLKKISQRGGYSAYLAKITLRELELSSSLPRWELERDVYANQYTGQPEDPEDINPRYIPYTDTNSWQNYLYTRKPYGEDEELNSMFIEANREFIPLYDNDENYEEDDYTPRTLKDIQSREPVFMKISDDYKLSEHGYDFVKLMNLEKLATSMRFDEIFTKYRDKQITWDQVDLAMLTAKYDFKVAIYEHFLQHLWLEPVDLLAGFFVVEGRYDLTDEIFHNHTIVDGIHFWKIRHQEGLIDPPMRPEYSTITMLELIKRYSDEVTDILVHTGGMPSEPQMDIESMCKRFLAEMLSTYPERADDVTDTRLWNEGYILAVLDGETETRNVAWEYYRENISEVGNIAFHNVLEKTGDIKKAWQIFYSSARSMFELEERITSISSSGPTVAHQFAEKGSKISWNLATSKIRSNAISLSQEDRDRLKEILVENKWAPSLIKLL